MPIADGIATPERVDNPQSTCWGYNLSDLICGISVPVKYIIDKKRRLVFGVVWGRLTYTEALAARDAILSDPDFDPEFNELVDASAQTELSLKADEARSLARQSIYSPTSKRAWVSSLPAMYGMGRLMATHQQMNQASPSISVFYNISEALKWLGLESLVDEIMPGVVGAKRL